MNENRPAQAAASLAGFVVATDRARSCDPRHAGQALPRSAEAASVIIPMDARDRP